MKMLCIHNKYSSHGAADKYKCGRFEQYRANDHMEMVALVNTGDKLIGICRTA
jgi:hypothetical protein